MQVSTATMAAIRFGYGFHARQTGPHDADGLIASLKVATKARPVVEIAGSAARRSRLEALIAERRTNGKGDKFQKMRKQMRRDGVRDGARSLYRRALSPHGFFERLVGFWADHFTVAGRNAGQIYMIPAFEVEAIRPHVTGRFEDMLIAVVQHPVMLNYLDQVESFGPNSRAGKRRGRGLNENLAREILELHTLGVGGPYSQTDVRELAELLTGYGVQKGYLKFRFFQQRAEPGAETVLGKRYGGDPAQAKHAAALLRDLARHPGTARHLARKLAVHFVADEPDPGLVNAVARAWERSGGDLMTVYRAMLDHPAAWRDFGQKIKQPVDLVVSTLRAMGANGDTLERGGTRTGVRIIRALQDLNQPLYRAPGPDGWPEEAEAWITPQGLAARLNFASAVGQLLAKRAELDPRHFAEATLRDALRPETAFAVGGAPDRWEGIALVLSSPEFNRR